MWKYTFHLNIKTTSIWSSKVCHFDAQVVTILLKIIFSGIEMMLFWCSSENVFLRNLQKKLISISTSEFPTKKCRSDHICNSESKKLYFFFTNFQRLCYFLPLCTNYIILVLKTLENPLTFNIQQHQLDEWCNVKVG